MAIEFAHVEIVQAGPSSSAVGLSAYVSRESRVNRITGQAYDFTEGESDVVAKGIALPKNAPAWAREATGAEIWNAAEHAELLKDGSRLRLNAQLAKHVILALPNELDPADQIALVLEFVEAEYTSRGIVVEWAVHRPDPGSPLNAHAHLIVATRYLTETGFGKKARELNPKFYAGSVVEADQLGAQWRAAQEGYFAARGLDISVDAKAAIPRRRLPRLEMREPGAVAAENAERAKAAKALVSDPATLLELVTETRAVFTARDISRTIAKHGIEGEAAINLRDRALKMALALADENGPNGYFTTKEIRESERLAVSLARTLRRKSVGWSRPSGRQITEAIERHQIDDEQREAVRTALGKDQGRISIWFGIAGAGKTRALQAARDAYESAGWTVLAAAPTNTVARDLEGAGFRASTLHRLLGEIERGRTTLDRRTVVVIDEAAMLSTEQFVNVLGAVERSEARVLLVGDDRQLGAIEPGGMFGVLRDELGFSEFRTVRRQREKWQKDATVFLAEGKMLEALELYAKAGAVHFEATTENAIGALVARWKYDSDPARAVGGNREVVRFVYARTNAEVNRLNLALREEAKEIGLVHGREITYAAERGAVTLAAGDRIQFRANDHRLRLFNGNVGTVLEVGEHKIRVRLDGGRELEFDPREYRDFTLGYAGTVFRGQGKTQTETYVLHGAYTDRASSYVALTRHSAQVSVFVGKDIAPDLETLSRQMGRVAAHGSSLRYHIADPRMSEIAPVARPRADVPSTADVERRRALSARVGGMLAKVGERAERARSAIAALDERLRDWLSGIAPDGFVRAHEKTPAPLVVYAAALSDDRTERLLGEVPAAFIPLDVELVFVGKQLKEIAEKSRPGPAPNWEQYREQALEILVGQIKEARVAVEAKRREGNPFTRLIADPARDEQARVNKLLRWRREVEANDGEGADRVRDLFRRRLEKYQVRAQIHSRNRNALDWVEAAREAPLGERRLRAEQAAAQVSYARHFDLADRLQQAVDRSAVVEPVRRERVPTRQIE